MRILQLNATVNWGSTGKITEGIGNVAISQGLDSYIGYGRYKTPSSSHIIKVGTKLDIYTHYAKHKFLNKEGYGCKRATNGLIKRISEIKPDIIHLHNIHDHWLNYPILFSYLKSIDTPVVWTFHDCWAFTGGCAHFVEYGCLKWKTDCSDCPLKRLNSGRSSKNLSDKIESIKSLGDRIHLISVSHWLDSLVAESRLGEISHSVIYNGIDTDTFKPRDYSEIESKYNLKGKKVLLAVSNVWPESKGLKDFIELRKFLDSDFIIILVGLPKDLISKLPDGILGIERTSNINELCAFYTRADAVLSLSKAETFGLTLIEGQACGTPSIGYASTAINELINDENGLKVETSNIQQIAEAAKFVCETKQFSSAVLRNNVIQNYKSDNQLKKYLELYSSLLS